MIAAPSDRTEPTSDYRQQDLLARCRAGDHAAFEEVHTRFGRAVFHYAYHLLRDYEEAADVQQETFVRAFVAIRAFRGDATLQTWLLKICRNLCHDRLKSWRHRAEITADPVVVQELVRRDDPHGDPASIMERSQRIETVRRALLSLPFADYEILILREMEDLGIAAIADLLGCSRPAAHVRLYRARRRLQERLRGVLFSEESQR